MNSLVTKWTTMLTGATSGMLGVLAAAAVIAIIVFVLMGIFAGNDQEKAGTVKTVVTILVFCAVAGCASALVTWAMS